jgi:hypothetical protein
MTQPEAKLVQKIKKYLHTKRAFFFKVHGSPFMMAGLPDLVVCYKGRFIGIEVKMPGNTASPQQARVGEKISESRGKWLVAYSVEQVEQFFELLDKQWS